MLTTCKEPGCATLVMGGRCLAHERPTKRVFVRGRPFAARQTVTLGTAYGVGTLGTGTLGTGAIRNVDLPQLTLEPRH